MANNLRDTLERTNAHHIHAYSGPNPFNPAETLPFRAPHCVHRLHPAESVPEAFRGPLYQEQYSHALNFLGPVIETCHFEISDVVVDEKRRIVATRLTGVFDLKAVGDEPAEKGYRSEYMYLTEMDESGEKIVRMDEFLDVQRMLGYISARAEKFAELKGSSEGGKQD